MESQNRYDGVDAYAVIKIRYQARRLALSRALHPSDLEDLEQELMLDLLRRLPAFDPSKASRNSFIARLVENHAATLIKAALAGKRGAAIPHESLQATIHEEAGDPIALGDTIPAEAGLWAPSGRGWDEAIALRHDLAQAIRRLSPRLVSLCGRLATGTVTEVSRATGMSRPAIYDAIAKLRVALTETRLGTTC